jgi:hypothetical protein
MFPRHGLNPARELGEFAYLFHDCGVWAAVKFESMLSLLDKRLDTGHFVLWGRLEERVLPHGLHDLLPLAVFLREVVYRAKRAGEDELELGVHYFDTLLVQSAERWCEFVGDCVSPLDVMDIRLL